MNRKVSALLLSALILPGLGQLYLGRRKAGAIILALANLLLLVGLFVLLRGLSPVIAVQLSGGAIAITPAEVLAALDSVSGFGRGILAAFLLLWFFSLVDIVRSQTGER